MPFVGHGSLLVAGGPLEPHNLGRIVRAMKLIGIGVAVLGLALAGAAHAQSQCYPNNPSVPAAGSTCYPTGAPPLPDEGRPQRNVGSVPRDLPNDGDPAFPAMCSGYYYAELGCMARANAERKEVGALMANGQCDDAMKRALREADYKMAATVKQLCTAGR